MTEPSLMITDDPADLYPSIITSHCFTCKFELLQVDENKNQKHSPSILNTKETNPKITSDIICWCGKTSHPFCDKFSVDLICGG